MGIYGGLFREIRMSRGLSIQDLADDFVSKSTISRFERMEADITFEKLVHLLDKLKVSMQEFVYLSTKKQRNRSSLELLSKALIENNTTLLHQLVEKEWQKYRETSDMYTRLVAIVLEYHDKNLQGEDMKNGEDPAFLIDYLFKCEMWTQFDMVIFANAMAFIPFETSITISKDLAKKTERFHSNRQSFETIINTLENMAMVCLTGNRLHDAKMFITIIEELDMDETYFLERVILKFIKGLYGIKIGERNQGEKEAKEALAVMNLAGSFQFERIFGDYLKQILK
ncbi:helix-turn-helix domain-containing protein [Paucisalibacillus globulus]|uniref:helix-turn-helix domain-containing protein n=1 Tax=Paucisalibacillus globulus TaxID=351095 RepID=UPI0003FF3C3F|nr:Rgg/GadR/MutR family transcriptional regulator [Paucisalibacillus globulus]